MSDGGLLVRIQQQVADRNPVDWRALEKQLQGDDELEQFELLRLLDRIALAHSEFQTADKGDEIDRPFPPGSTPSTGDDALQSWGRYRLDELVGTGSFGRVYRAWDPELEMAVAIKILHRRFGDEHLKDRLLLEGRALAQVKHPNVVRVLTVEQNDGRLGLVMEFLRGETLDAMVGAQGLLNEREATVIAEDVCRALAAVHANKLVHRDVKARNIIRERAGRIVLMDFGAGLSEARRQDESGVIGTPFYMAPEMLRGEPASVASDVYAVGVLLFFLVTRRYPFDAATVDDLRNAHAVGRRLSLMELRPELPVAFVKVVDRALAPDGRDRYASASALLQALLEARDAAPAWRRWLSRAALIAVGLGALLTLAGMLSSAAFNQTLGRAEYSTETAIDWFVIGRRSLMLPLVMALLGVGAIGMAAAARNLAVAASSRVRAIDRRVTRRCSELADRLSLRDAGVCSCWLLLITAIAAIAAGVHWAPLLRSVASNAATAPADALAILSPAFEEYQTNYRVALSVLAAANLAGWYGLVRAATARGARLPRWLSWGEIAVIVLLYGSLQVPYRLINDNDEFPVVQWGAERCYVLGERAEDTLLFCPMLSPRNRIVPKSAGRLAPSHAGESLFATFAPQVP